MGRQAAVIADQRAAILSQLLLGDWADDAACIRPENRGLDWFPSKGASSGVARCRAVCATCPVSDPCLRTALQVNGWDDYGIWGGTTRDERRDLRRVAA